MSRIQNKVCLITGGAGGVGRETALTFAREGGRVVVSDLNSKAGLAVAEEIAARYSAKRVLFIQHDVSSEDDWQVVMAQTIDRFGRLDVLVNNAGILIKGSIEEATLEQWHKIQRINADSVFLGCKAAVKIMKDSGGGAIVNVSSITGLAARPDYAVYGASKHAVLGLSRSVAIHCRQQKYRIRCNTVHPDGVLTPMTIADAPPGYDLSLQTIDRDPMKRMCLPQDVADAILFLASDESRAINGTELRIDGGQLLMSL